MKIAGVLTEAELKSLREQGDKEVLIPASRIMATLDELDVQLDAVAGALPLGIVCDTLGEAVAEVRRQQDEEIARLRAEVDHQKMLVNGDEWIKGVAERHGISEPFPEIEYGGNGP